LTDIPLRDSLHSLLALALALASAPSELCGQHQPSTWLVVAPGLGGSAAQGPRYEGSAIWEARVGVGLRFRTPVELEAAIDVIHSWGHGPFGCELNPTQCPAHSNLAGASLELLLNPRSVGKLAPFRASVGVGAYRVGNDMPYPDPPPKVTALGLQIGLEYTMWRWSHVALYLGARALLIPRANGESLWLFPVGLGGRVY